MLIITKCESLPVTQSSWDYLICVREDSRLPSVMCDTLRSLAQSRSWIFSSSQLLMAFPMSMFKGSAICIIWLLYLCFFQKIGLFTTRVYVISTGSSFGLVPFPPPSPASFDKSKPTKTNSLKFNA